MTTTFRPIKGCPGYAIGESGEVISFKSGEPRFMKPENNGCGYLSLILHNKGKAKMHSVHSLVAQAFLGDRPEGMVIDHIDGNRLNNHYTNLRYCTQSDNLNNPNSKHGGRPGRKIVAINGDGERTFENCSEMCRQLGLRKCRVRYFLSHKTRRSTCGGYTFRWA